MNYGDNPTDKELVDWLSSIDFNYSNIHRLNEAQWVCVNPFMFTFAIIIGTIGDESGYDDRWCYQTKIEAIKALDDWLKHPEQKEPSGWHRHPESGRRRINGDPSTEYINI